MGSIIVIDENERHGLNLERELNAFLEEGNELRNSILEGKMDMIRKYAATNEHEFFACCVEYFFESPEDFKSKLPSLYHRLCAILNQDPTNKSGDFVYTENNNPYIARKKAAYSKQFVREPSNWYQWMIAYGMFIGWFIMVQLLFRTESSMVTIVLFFAMILSVGILLFHRRFYVSGFMTRESFVLFTLGGWLPSAASVLLVLNFLIPVYSFQVVDEYSKMTVANGKYLAVAENSSLRALRNGVETEYEVISQKRNSNQKLMMETTVYYGVFGIKMSGQTKFYLAEALSE